MTDFSIPKRYTSELKKPIKLDARLQQFATGWAGDCGVLLCGPTTIGKSLSAAMALSRVSAGNASDWALWVRADELSRVLATRDNIAEVEKLKSALILVVDELGYEQWPALALEVLGVRYDRELVTVVTSGLKLDVLVKRYSDSVIRKITDIGNGCIIDCWREPGNARAKIGSGVLPPAIIYARTPKSVLQARAISENLNAGRLI